MKKALLTLLKVGITVGLLALVFRKFQVSRAGLLGAIGGAEAFWLVAALGAQALAILLSVIRWGLLLRGQKIVVPFRHLATAFMVGRFFGNFTPTGVGLEAYKAYDIARHTHLVAESVSVVFVEKIIGFFFSLCLLILLTLPVGIQIFPPQFFALLFAVFLLPVLFATVLFFRPTLLEGLLRLPLPARGKVEGKLRKAVETVTIYRGQRGLLLGAVTLGIGVHLGTTLIYYCLARALHVGAGFADILPIGPLIIAGTLVPVSIAGIGIRESLFVFLLRQKLGPAAFAEDSAMLASHLVYWVGVALNLVGAVIYLTRPASYRPEITGEALQRLLREGKMAGAPAREASR